jgi:3-oxoacyl-[acyl-carrier protein] reductase
LDWLFGFSTFEPKLRLGFKDNIAAKPSPRTSNYRNRRIMTNVNRVVISGGASGIGLACAQQLARAGAKLALLDLNPNIHESLATLDGEGHRAFEVNVTDSTAVQSAINSFATEGAISGVVVSAGIVSQELLVDISAENFAKVMNINVMGVQNVVAPVARNMISHGVAGSIVVLASVAAFNGGGLMGRGAYATSKSAVLGMVRSYARELAEYKIRANTVAPGATETPMTASLSEEARERIMAQTLNGRFLESDEVVNVINFLLSDASSAINGQTIHANGGIYLA